MANRQSQNYGWSEASLGNNQFPVPSAPKVGHFDYRYQPELPSGSAPPYPEPGFPPDLPDSSIHPGISECPVCKISLVPPIYQCSKGHVLCNLCIENLDFCISQPECLAPLEGLKLRNFSLEQSLYHLETSCPNAGCPSVVSTGVMANHLEVCKFRSFPCSSYFGWKCRGVFSQGSLLSHLRKCHQVEETEHDKFTLNLIASRSLLEEPGQGREITWSPVLITPDAIDDDHLLLKCFTTPNGYISLTGYLLPTTTNDTDRQRYRIKFQINSISNGSRLEWTGRLISHYPNEPIDPTIAFGQLSNLNSFRVPLHLLSDCIENCDESSKLNIKVVLVKLPNENWDGDGDLNEVQIYPASSPAQLSPEIGAKCNHCRSQIQGQVLYQCLHCPSHISGTYFCPNCIQSGYHDKHLTVRIPNPELQPLAAVAYECCVRDLQ